jgi:hypothetical protein
MIPNPTTPNLADIPIQVSKIHAPPTLRPVHRPGNAHAAVLEPGLPRLDVRDVRDGEAEMLFEETLLRGQGKESV